MWMLSLYYYNDACILVKGTITILNMADTCPTANNANKKVIIKNCAPFNNCISEINNTQWDHTKGIDVVMPIYNLIEYSDKYSKTWLCNRDESVLNAAGTIIDFLVADSNSNI